MKDLTSSGLVLRTLDASDWPKFVEDMNFNLTQILNLPGFKGQPGLSVTGPAGVGIRGSKWVFVKMSDMQNVYNITDASEVDLAFINQSFDNDSALLFSSLDIPSDDELIIGDLLVLPEGQIIELSEVVNGNQTTVQFTDTGVTFAQVSSLSESRVRAIFNELFQGGNQTNGSFRNYAAVAKNNTDASPAVNQNINNDSIIDILVSSSGPGAALPTHKFVAATEQDVTTDTQMCLIAGSPVRYHELLQETQRIHTNNYAPGIDDFAAQVILQNSYKNGLIFGHRNSESIRQFGRLYRSVNSTILTSSYSPLENEYSDIQLSDDAVTIRANRGVIRTTSLEIMAGVLTSEFLSWSGNTVKLANKANAKLEIWAPEGTYLKSIVDANVLSTDATGKLIKAYTVLTAMPTTATNSQLLTALAVANYRIAVNTRLDALESDVTDLQNQDTSTYFKKTVWYASATNLNSITVHGNSLVAIGTAISNFLPNVTAAPADMHINTFVIDNGGTKNRMLQEVTMTGGTLGNYMLGVKWFRTAEKAGTAQWQFSAWSKTVTNIDVPTGDSAIVVSGSFADELRIRHAGTTATSTNNVQPTEAVKNITLDEFGHVRRIDSEDYANVFLGINGPVSQLHWSATNQTALSIYLSEFMRINRPMVVVTGTFDIYDGQTTTWVSLGQYTATNSSFDAVGPGHTVIKSLVKWKRTSLGGHYDFVDIEIYPDASATAAERVTWNDLQVIALLTVREGSADREPIFAPQETRAVVTGSVSGSTVRRFALHEGNGPVQEVSLKIVVQRRRTYLPL